MAKPPSRKSSSQEISNFLQKSKAITQFVDRQPRLLFAIDATASRQPTWDMAMQMQADMFHASVDVAPLAVQLAYYRGLGELHFGRWENDTRALAQRMSEVSCAAGRTQIGRLLQRALRQQGDAQARALVFIGDAVEEPAAALEAAAGACRLKSLPLFLFQEGNDPAVRDTFARLAQLSGGASERFDARSPGRLAELLGAVARYAAGGRAALENSASSGARLLLDQLPR